MVLSLVEGEGLKVAGRSDCQLEHKVCELAADRGYACFGELSVRLAQATCGNRGLPGVYVCRNTLEFSLLSTSLPSVLFGV